MYYIVCNVLYGQCSLSNSSFVVIVCSGRSKIGFMDLIWLLLLFLKKLLSPLIVAGSSRSLDVAYGAVFGWNAV